jgi:hypothetical protein
VVSDRAPETGGEKPGTDRAAPRDEAASVREALARFDQGRDAGRDLEGLFRELEADLGLDSGVEDAEGPAPDFPGVVGAMVEEFLWEQERENGREAAERCASLRLLSEYAAQIGVFEELGRRELLDFCARWLLDEDKLDSSAQVDRLFEALGSFCRWSESQHAHDLWTCFGGGLESLAESVSRLVEARREHELAQSEADRIYEVTEIRGDQLELADLAGKPRSARVPKGLGAHLRPGDLLRAELLADGGARPAGCYPQALREQLPGTS